MKESPLVSIITPSYNQGAYLAETIESVLSQTYDRIEYMVIDGGSTDESVDVIRRYEKDLAYWVSEPDRGQTHAINKGLERASGTILSWINSDDTLLPDTVRRVVDNMSAEPMVIYGGARLIDENSQAIVRPKLSKRNRDFGLETLVDDNLVNQPGTFWNRAIMDRVGLPREDLDYVMDYELWVRMALAGARFKRLGDPPLATYRLAAGTKTVAEMYRQGLEKMEVLDELLADPQLAEKMGISPAALRRKARRSRAFASLKVVRSYVRMPGRRLEGLGWLARAVWLWPPALLLVPEYLIKRLSVSMATRLGQDVPSW